MTQTRGGSDRFLIALGSNIAHPRHGTPSRVLRAAFAALRADGHRVLATSPVIATVPLGPSRRMYANAAALIESALAPLELLDRLQAIEASFGRTRRSQRWSARTLDLDIVLWSRGVWRDRRLVIPHREYRKRAFVLIPAAAIAPDWRDPETALRVKHLLARLTRRPAPPKARAPQGAGPIAQSVEQLTFNQ